MQLRSLVPPIALAAGNNGVADSSRGRRPAVAADDDVADAVAGGTAVASDEFCSATERSVAGSLEEGAFLLTVSSFPSPSVGTGARSRSATLVWPRVRPCCCCCHCCNGCSE